ncbi:MFS transporter [Paraburkholderia strydomiana]
MQIPLSEQRAASELPDGSGDSQGVDALLDNCMPLRPLQKLTYALCALVAWLDGMDSQAVGVAGSALAAHLGVGSGSLGAVFAAGQIGYMLGAFTLGLLADRLGRRPMLVFSVLLFGATTVATSFAANIEQLVGIRLIAGIGLGGATPCFITLASEYLPRKMRRPLITALFAAYPLGGMAGGFLGSYVVGHFGWRMLFYVVGGMPLILGVVLVFMLPETLQYLTKRNDQQRLLATLGRLLGPDVSPNVRLRVDSPSRQGPPLATLFSDGRAVPTVILWALFFVVYGALSTIFLWYPSLLGLAGVSAANAAWMVGMENFGGVFGMLAAGALMVRFGNTRVLLASLSGVSLAMLCFSATDGAVYKAAACMLLIGLLLDLAASGIVAMCASVFPTEVRSTVVGWGMGIGRFGQVSASLIVGHQVSARYGFEHIASSLAIAPAVSAVLVVLLALATRNRRNGSEAGYAS